MAKRASKSSSRPSASKPSGKPAAKAGKASKPGKPLSKGKPVSKGKPFSKGKPVSKGQSASKAKPASQAKAVSKGKPLAKAKPANKPAAKASPKMAPKASGKPAKPVAAPAFDPGLASPAPASAPLTEREAKLKRQQETSRAFAIEVARLCKDDKCTDVVLLDVRGLSSVTDYIIIGSGTSDRQMKSVLDHVAELGHKYGFTQSKTNSDDRSTWLLIDFADVTVHLFEPTTRAHYDIEMLWGDAPRLEWERPDQIDRDRAGLAASRR